MHIHITSPPYIFLPSLLIPALLLFSFFIETFTMFASVTQIDLTRATGGTATLFGYRPQGHVKH